VSGVRCWHRVWGGKAQAVDTRAARTLANQMGARGAAAAPVMQGAAAAPVMLAALMHRRRCCIRRIAGSRLPSGGAAGFRGSAADMRRRSRGRGLRRQPRARRRPLGRWGGSARRCHVARDTKRLAAARQRGKGVSMRTEAMLGPARPCLFTSKVFAAGFRRTRAAALLLRRTRSPRRRVALLRRQEAEAAAGLLEAALLRRQSSKI